MPVIDNLVQDVNYVAQTQQMGGRCSAVDSHRCVLFDSANWTHAMHTRIRQKYPTCVITVSAMESSISGFVVIFDLHEPLNRMFTTFLVLAVIAGLGIATYYIFRSLACSGNNIVAMPSVYSLAC